jgi:predicted enzyme related to lactoylglutathione lyase
MRTTILRTLLGIALLATYPLSCLATASSAFPGVAGKLYLALSVSDFDRSVEWYGRVLNLEKLDDTSDPKGVWRIANLVSKDVWIEVIHDRRNKPMQGAQGIVKAGFSVHDVDEIVEHATRLGLTKPRVVDSKLHHLRIVQLTDPDGNILQFTSPLDEVHDDK